MKIIVTGVTGQVGSYMVEYLLKNTDFEIYGTIRRLSVPNHKNIEHIDNPRFKIIQMDLSDQHSIEGCIEEIKPDFFINFAANSYVGYSWKMPINHFQVNTLAVLHQLEAIRKHCPNCRYYNAGSSEEFGDVAYTPQDSKHPLRPRSPYGASKASARQIVKVWRDSYDLYAIQGWLFNHESERRGLEFVTRKITNKVAEIKKAIENDLDFEPLELGNMEAKRDWSHAQDFVKGIWLMLNQEKPKEYVLASGETHTVKEFVDIAFREADIGEFTILPKLYWRGENETTELLYGKKVVVRVNPKFYRPAEVELLLGDSSEAEKGLNWEKEVDFQELVRRMVRNDIKEQEGHTS
jgi:GDPmannose 4,6-dehydratase